MKKNRRFFSALFSLCLGLILLTAPAHADEYPAKTIHMVIPWAAGGGTDSIGRGIAEAMKPVVKEAVVVDNISGAGGVTGTVKVANSKPDGYTLLMNGTTDMTAVLTFTKVPFTLDDLAYIGGFFTSPTWILSHKDRGYKDMQGFLAKAKADPGNLTVGTAGPAGAQMIMAAAIKGITGIDFRIIPYSGGADLVKALIGNQVDAGIIHAPVMLAEVKGGLIEVLGSGMPLDKINYEPLRNTKTLKDIGIPVEIGITRGIFVPKETPKEVRDRLSAIVEKAAKSEAFKNFCEKFGFAPVWIPGPDFEKQIRAELALFHETKAKYIDK
ncbi:MAG: tripartite tricarboxylate transporter substrate binding protein [Desulfobacteraceae bacterium]|nr:MAG: tripartite tricarboxylate transporter substrate binding protein [Desulfobacteraceae bacterium]